MTEVTPVTVTPIPYRDTWTVCADCGHEQTHHGHLSSDLRWVDDGQCFVWVEPPRTAGGRKKGSGGCRCAGWAPGLKQ